MKCYLGMDRRVIKLNLKGILCDVVNEFIMGFTSRALGMIEIRKCLLSFSAESFVFQVATQKFKVQDI